MDIEAIKAVIVNYRKSEIQSEAEVSSKFIVPLFQALGYSDELMAQEFPVYGYAGRQELTAKNADFLYFSDRGFANHRNKTQSNKKWVQDHSLIVVEAKKPGKEPEDMGQAQFYASWTKAIAYVVTDGESFRAYYRNNTNSDFEVIDTSVDELSDTPELEYLEYEQLLTIKNAPSTFNKKNLSIRDENQTLITNDEDLKIPEETLAYFRHCLGKNSIGLTNLQLVSKFLNTTDFILDNDLRYDIPEYMLDIPRHWYDAHLYVENSLFPITSGTITEFYRDEHSRYLFESDYIVAEIRMVSNRVFSYEIGYHIWDKTVEERLQGFKLVKQVLDSKNVSFCIDNDSKMVIRLPKTNHNTMWRSKKYVTDMFYFWYDGMQKLKDIEEYYEICFDLKQVAGQEELNQLYEAIDIVHAGIKVQENCAVTYSDDFEFDGIDYPISLEGGKPITLQNRYIQGITFTPYTITLLPCKKAKRKHGLLEIPACCEYRIDIDEAVG